VGLLSPETEIRGLSCQLNLNPDLSDVYTDPDILTQIFVNLILNAAEAMDNGGVLSIRTFSSRIHPPNRQSSIQNSFLCPLLKVARASGCRSATVS
jgi:nitrogen-specific signal transduction histidine kinase